jgi:ABC-type amino acid transport substrate-binding protein
MSKRWNSSLPSALLLTGVVAFSFGFVAQAHSDPVCAALVITGHPSYPPIAWATQGKIVGAAPNLVAGIAAKLGVKDVVSKDFGSWEGAQQAARSGQADVIFGIYKNDARALYLDYIEPPS